jgi:hypothetical protein
MTDEVMPCEVLIAGGGPAGATALLAEQGRQVVLLEKARQPRVHLGESLLLLNLVLFDRFGVREEIEATSIRKYGVEFNSPTHDAPVTLDFFEAWDKNFPYAYQVRRSEFDHILIRNAARCGSVRGCAREARGIQSRWPRGTCDGGCRRRWHPAMAHAFRDRRFGPGFALIAQRAGVPVQTVLIETDCPFLGKGWRWWRRPRFPVRYQVHLGRRFMVDGDARAFSAMLEAYFEDELRGSRLMGPDV